MPVIDQFLKNNAEYAVSFEHGKLPMPPAKKVAVVACMDARLHPEPALGIQLGDAHVIRNAGGRVSDALRSIVISQTLLGTEEVAIIHHHDCGMLTFTDDTIRQRLREERGIDASDTAFLPFPDLEQSIRDDIARYEASPLVRHDVAVRGFIYDVDSGRLAEVS